MAEVDYGAGHNNFGTLKFLSDDQMMIIKDLSALTEISRTACEKSAK